MYHSHPTASKTRMHSSSTACLLHSRIYTTATCPVTFWDKHHPFACPTEFWDTPPLPHCILGYTASAPLHSGIHPLLPHCILGYKPPLPVLLHAGIHISHPSPMHRMTDTCKKHYLATNFVCNR